MNTQGFIAKTEEIERIWKHNAQVWSGLSSPWRPSKADLELYRILSGEHMYGSVLILGATPELRDLVSKHNRNYIVADISDAMLMSTSTLLKNAKVYDEIWAKCDWAKLPNILRGGFDLIIGDMVWWVLSIESQKQVRNAIYSLLGPQGLFVTRIRVQNLSVTALSPKEIITSHIEKLLQGEDYNLVKNNMLSDLYDKFFDENTKRLSNSDVKKFLRGDIQNMFSSKIQSFLQEASNQTIGTDWTIQTESELMKLLSHSFSLSQRVSANDYLSDYYPVMAFSK